MIKRLKTIEQIKSEWGCNFKEDGYKAIRFYDCGHLNSHITFSMLKYFGKEVEAKKTAGGHYQWIVNDEKTGTWRFKEEWFVSNNKIEFLEDDLFEI